MRARLKKLFSTDVDLDSYTPSDPSDFAFLLRLMVGPAEDDGEESFDVEVCTPKWLMHKYRSDDVIMGRHFLLVFDYDRQRIIQFVTDFVNGCSGNSWTEIAQKVARLGLWEFEDYREYDGEQQ